MLRAATAGQTVVPFPSPSAIDPPGEERLRCSLLELAGGGCRWPLSDPGKDDFGFCGNAAISGIRTARAMRGLPTGCPPGGARRARGEGLGGGGLSFGSLQAFAMRGLPRSTLQILRRICGGGEQRLPRESGASVPPSHVLSKAETVPLQFKPTGFAPRNTFAPR